MTRVDAFVVDGLAGRKRPIEYALNGDVNVFYGLNGTGKTTLLKIINAALQDDSSALIGLPFKKAQVTFFSHYEDQTLTRSIEMSARPRDELFELGAIAAGANYSEYRRHLARAREMSWVTNPASDLSYSVSYLSTSRLTGDLLSSTSSAVQPPRATSDRDLDERFAEHVRFLWRVYANKTLSEVRRIQEAGLAGILRTLFSNADSGSSRQIDASVAYQRANGFLKRQGVRNTGSLASFRKLYDEDPRLREVVEQIDAIERRIERVERPRRELEELVQQFVGEGKKIEFSDADIIIHADDGDIPLRALSSGEKQLLRIMVEVISKDTSVVVIDEPELSVVTREVADAADGWLAADGGVGAVVVVGVDPVGQCLSAGRG